MSFVGRMRLTRWKEAQTTGGRLAMTSVLISVQVSSEMGVDIS